MALPTDSIAKQVIAASSLDAYQMDAAARQAGGLRLALPCGLPGDASATEAWRFPDHTALIVREGQGGTSAVLLSSFDVCTLRQQVEAIVGKVEALSPVSRLLRNLLGRFVPPPDWMEEFRAWSGPLAFQLRHQSDGHAEHRARLAAGEPLTPSRRPSLSPRP